MVGSITEYFKTDQATVTIFSDKYYSIYLLLAQYPIFERNYKYLSVIGIVVNMFILPIHFVLLIYTATSVVNIDFGLCAALIDIILPLWLAMFFVFVCQLKRRSFEAVNKEILQESYYYNKNVHFRPVNNEDKTEKLKFAAATLTVIVLSAGLFLAIFSGYLDTRFGSIKPELLEMHITFHLPFPIRYPVNVLDSNTFYCIALLTQYVTLFTVCHNIVSTVYIFVTLFGGLVQQVDILLNSIRTIKHTAYTLYLEDHKSDKFILKPTDWADVDYLDKYLTISLRRIFQHHQQIMRMFSAGDGILSSTLGMIWSVCMLAIGLNLYAMGTEHSLPGRMSLCYAAFSGGVVVSAFVSYACQTVTSMTDENRFEIYSTEWYNFSKTFKRDMLIFQEVTKRSLGFRILGLYPCNLTSFTDVLQSAYSIYNFLRLTK